MTAATVRPLRRETAPAPAYLDARNVTLTYRTKRGLLTALQNLSLAVGRHEFVSVIGPSGCGKSTLLKAISGLLPISAGTIALGGMPVDGPRPQVGIVFQAPTLLPWKTVIENVLVPARAMRLDMARYCEKAMDLLRLVGLEPFAGNYPHELSGGMQQRVGLARGLIHDPDILLMDEPFAALDAITRENMGAELQRLWMTTGKSVLFITHHIPEAVFLSDRVIILSNRPAHVINEIAVDLPRPRTLATMADPRFAAMCNDLRVQFQHVDDTGRS
ncbi:MAG: ABC transporter ATP-binding protein [Alphaproteobacteria bacterium]